MPKFAANLTMLFTEVASLDRPSLAAQAGFDGVEVLFPYDIALSDWQSALNGMPVALINTPPGDWALGARGFAAVPGAESQFRESFARAVDYANGMGAGLIHVMAGVAKGAEAEQTFFENLSWAAGQVPDLALTIEPLNIDDMPAYFLNDFDQAGRILDDLALPNVGLQFDLWHAARIHGDATAVWARHQSRVNHIQIAGFPNRNEPGGGGFDLTALCAEVDAMARPIWISGEYRPARATVHGLNWLTALKARADLMGA